MYKVKFFYTNDNLGSKSSSSVELCINAKSERELNKQISINKDLWETTNRFNNGKILMIEVYEFKEVFSF